MRLSIGLAAALALAAVGLVAGRYLASETGVPEAPAGVDLAGEAGFGTGAHPATLRLACGPAAGLSARLTLPDLAAWGGGFDAGALGAAPLAEIKVAGGAAVRGVRAQAHGSTDGTASVLTVAGVGRGADPLRGIAPGLAEAGARLTWTQPPPPGGGAPLVARFTIAAGDAAALGSALGPCLGP